MMNRLRRLSPAGPGFLLAAACLVAACESTPPRVATTLQMVSGDQQTAQVATSVSMAPSVKVLDQDGAPLADQTVVFSVTGGGGSVANPSARTDAGGVASAGSWTLGTTAGANTLSATVGQLPAVRFEATGTPGSPAQVTVASGGGQQARVTEAVATPPAVRVADAYGNASAGVAVTFAVSAGGGAIEGASQTSNAQGVATVGRWTMGERSGENTLRASIAGGASTTIAATATAGDPASVEKAGGDEQTATVDTPVGEAPAVLVEDEYGNPVPGVTVTFTAAGGEGTAVAARGTVEPTSALTGVDGRATVESWRLGTVVGENTLIAEVEGLAPVTFTATSTPDVPAAMTAAAGMDQGASVGSPVPVPPTVLVADRHGNGVPGVAVEFVVLSGGGSVSGASTQTNAMGRAAVGSWTMGPTPGPNRLEARSPGLDAVAFDATGTQQPASITLQSGNGQSSTVGTAVPAPLAVLVRDAVGNPIPGVSVSWTVTAGSGTAEPATSVTDASGVATLASWTLGTAAGPNTLNATVGALAPAVFTATGVAGAAASVAVHAGNNQTATIGTAVAVPPAVFVADQHGNGVGGVAVGFAVTGGGGGVTGANPSSDASGVAEVGGWTLGPAEGPNELQATVTGLAPVTFDAEGVAAPPSFNLSIAGVHLNQGNQSTGGTVGGVAGRAGLLRVVVMGNELNTHSPDVRVRLYQGGTLLREVSVPAPRVGAPSTPNLNVLTDTWNVPLAAGEVVAGLRVEAEVDPGGAIPENTEADNRYPASGTANLDVTAIPPLNVVFIPVIATVQGTTGSVTAGNADAFLSATRDLIPSEVVTPTVHAPYTTAHSLSVASNWNLLLAEIQVVRTAEAATDQYYHGIIGDFPGIPYGGLAYRPSANTSTARSGLSYDRSPFHLETIAHELGHNLGRMHAPCGGAGNIDPNYPYPGALIGPPGYVVSGGTLLSGVGRYDYMSYCDPSWTSDYTYSGILGWRRTDPYASPPGSPERSASPTSGILLWGSVGPAGMTLNPAFAMEAAPVLPSQLGPWTLRGVGADGGELFRIAFAGDEVEDGATPEERHFTWFVPLGAERAAAVARIELLGPGGTISRTSSRGGVPGAPPSPELLAASRVRLERPAPGRARLLWDGAAFPAALVRDALTGQVLSIARGGEVELVTGSLAPERLEVVLSDGVRSVVRRPEQAP